MQRRGFRATKLADEGALVQGKVATIKHYIVWQRAANLTAGLLQTFEGQMAFESDREVSSVFVTARR